MSDTSDFKKYVEETKEKMREMIVLTDESQKKKGYINLNDTSDSDSDDDIIKVNDGNIPTSNKDKKVNDNIPEAEKDSNDGNIQTSNDDSKDNNIPQAEKDSNDGNIQSSSAGTTTTTSPTMCVTHSASKPPRHITHSASKISNI